MRNNDNYYNNNVNNNDNNILQAENRKGKKVNWDYSL